MGHVVDEFANMSEVPNVPFAIRVIDLRSMIHVENVASVTEGWGFNITDERGRPLVPFDETHGEAEVAARHVQAVVEKALAIHPMSRG